MIRAFAAWSWLISATGAAVMVAVGGLFLLGDYTGTASEAELPSGEVVEIDSFAQSTLGLTDEQAEALFYSDNTIEDVRRIIEAIKDGDLEPLHHDDYLDDQDGYDDDY